MRLSANHVALRHCTRVLLATLGVFFTSTVVAENRVVDLEIAYKKVNFTGKTIVALAANHQIPAPVLHFKEGDHVTINVYNKLNEETAIHWHGVILPWQMDGVLGISQRGIQPGSVFQYRFTLHQAGTYWYHAHAGLQEQQGIYGAFIIDPVKRPAYHYTNDYAIVLSDWSNTHPDQILSNLKKEGDYYSPNFPLQPSLMKFIHDYRKAAPTERRLLMDDYMMMQQMRMSIYDFSDVAYDAYLLNGKTKSQPWTALVKVGDTVRLRFIGAAGSTIYRVKIADTTMQMVHVDGNDIKPYTVNDFSIAPGETYDVLVKIKKNSPYIIYAESIDTLGAAYGALVTAPNQVVNYKQVESFPEPLPVTRGMMALMMGSKDSGRLPAEKVHITHATPTHIARAPVSASAKIETKSDAVADIKKEGEVPMNHGAHMDPSKPMDHSQPMDHSMPMDHSKPMDHSAPMDHSKPMDHNMPMNHPKPVSTTKPHANMAMHSMHASSSSSSSTSMSHDMAMPTEATRIGDSIEPPTDYYETSKGTQYAQLTGSVPTNDPNKSIAGVINMQLFGYMDRYIWFINGVPEDRAHPIILMPGKRYRFVFTNTSMMHHPMHIHGHWFILRKGDGAHDPLLHTIDVAPGATITADVDTDASGQWLFHCHMLYHMMSGMARSLQYSTLIEITKNEAKPQDVVKLTPYANRPIVRVDEVRPIDPALVRHPMAHGVGLWLATFLDVGASPFDNLQRVTYRGLYGRDYNKLELYMNDAEISKGSVENADIDIYYWHLISQFWAVKSGVNYFYRPATAPYWQPGVGLEGLMPYYIDTDVRGYVYSGSAKLDVELSRDTQITNNFFIRLGVRSILASKTVTGANIGSGLNQMRYLIRPYYRLMPGLNLVAEFEHEKYYGVYKNIQRNAGEATSESSLTLGLSIVF